MRKFQITLVRPQGFLHAEAFREVAETVQFGLRSLGHTAQIGENVIDPKAINILLGAHLLPPGDVEIVPAGSILYNLEQLGRANLSWAFYELARRHQVWDYSLRNMEKWRIVSSLRPPVHVPVGYMPELNRIQAASAQDIDVLFCGSTNQRRSVILTALKGSGVSVHVASGVCGKERDELIARAKIVLLVHACDGKGFDIIRLSYLLTNAKAVVAECSPDEPTANGAFLAVPYDSLAQSCLSLLRSEEHRRKLETRGFEWFSAQRESEILNRALSQYAAAGDAIATTMVETKPSVAIQPAHITQVARTTDSPLVSHLQAAFDKAMAGEGEADPAVLEIDGMSGRKYRLLINNLIASLPAARYLEIGTWSGSTLCSAVNRNSVHAVAIDNWSEFGGPKDQFLRNLARFKTPDAEVAFIEGDFRSIDYANLGHFNVYMFDGPHTAADQFDGINLVLPALEDEFVLIVDDWNHPPARQGTLKALHDLNLSVLYSFEIRTTLDGSHAALARQASDWHNGYLVAVVSKPRPRPSHDLAHQIHGQAAPA
jgi:hypothetical protein